MRTFKVTFFAGLEVHKIETFHNVTDQDAMCKLIANWITVLNLSPILKCEDSEGRDYSKALTYCVSDDIKELDKDYIKNYLSGVLGLNL